MNKKTNTKMKIIITKLKSSNKLFELAFDNSIIKIDEKHENVFYYDRLRNASDNDESVCLLIDETKKDNIEVLESAPVIVESFIKGNEDNINVSFWNHPAIFILRNDTENFIEYLKLLSDSIANEHQIFISTKNGELINVRPYDGKTKILLEDTKSFKFIPSLFRATVTEPELAEIFTFLLKEACVLNPTNIDVCITFQYVWDGCFARAHKMKQVMEQHFNVSCEKIFNYGSLAVSAYNHCVTWGWHVAPVLSVIKSDGTYTKFVLDPSVSNRPLTVDEWRNLQLNSCSGRAYLADKDIVDGRCYGRKNRFGNYTSFDDDYSLTNSWMKSHRNTPTFE